LYTSGLRRDHRDVIQQERPMFSLPTPFQARQPSRARLQWALERTRPAGPQPPATAWPFSPRLRSPDPDHLFFAVRSVAADGAHHTLQYSVVDARGNVALSAFARAPSPVRMAAHQPPEDLPAQPLEAAELERMLTNLCGGAVLVGFHRVLQGGLLPEPTVRAAAGLECAWRRFLKVARARGWALEGGSPSLADALAAVGAPPLTSPDAALRALAIRELWSWMDRAA
jgi:hypothetical protein